jgi:hypothetical protein
MNAACAKLKTTRKEYFSWIKTVLIQRRVGKGRAVAKEY